MFSCSVPFVQLKVYGTPIKAAPQPVVERPAATSSPSPAPAPATAPAPAPPSLPEEALEKIAPVEIEGKSGRSVAVIKSLYLRAHVLCLARVGCLAHQL